MKKTDEEMAEWDQEMAEWMAGHSIGSHRAPRRHIPWGLLLTVICTATVAALMVLFIWAANPPRLRY
jgi:hypothetical protein